VSTTPTLDPRVIGQAENAHKPILERVLRRTGTTFHEWVALSLTAGSGGAITRDLLAKQVAGALKIEGSEARSAIGRLIGAALLEAGPGEPVRVTLTDAGALRHAQIRGAVDEVVARAYGDLPQDDLATAGRVLTVITSRLNAELANDS
jgi:hypothetical protein